MAKQFKKLMKTPLLYMCILSIILIVILMVYGSYQKKSKPICTMTTSEMEQSVTSYGIDHPLKAVVYVMNAMRNNNLDQLLRCSPILQRTYNADAAQIIDAAGSVSAEGMAPPAREYGSYGAFGQSIWTNYYEEFYRDIEKELNHLPADYTVERIDFLSPSNQLENSYRHQIALDQKCWNMNEESDVIVLLKAEEQYYMLTFKVAKYDTSWYVFDSNTITPMSEEPAGIWNTTKDDYLRYVDEESVVKDLESQLQVSSDENYSEVLFVADENDVVLPLNYFLSNQLYADSIENLMKNIRLSLNKQDTSQLLAYMNQYDGEPSLESVKQQAEQANALKVFIYHVLNRNFSVEETTLIDLGVTGSSVVSWLSPDSMRYLSFGGIQNYEELGDGRAEAELLFRFNGEYITTGWTFIQSENGWQVDSLCAENLGYSLGEIR